MIDLHLHTSASDGRDRPAVLVARVAAAGIRVLAVTDHDTVAGLAETCAAATRHGLGWIPGIEITAVEHDRDVHVLAYGFDPGAPSLAAFLESQRDSRRLRLREFGRRLGDLGLPIDIGPLLAMAEEGSGRSVGRAHVARALVAAGHVTSVDEAFARWLSPGHPAFVPRRGVPVHKVVEQIRAAGGIASLAHPRLLEDDSLVQRLLASGLSAVEAFHSDHDECAAQRYAELARRAGLAVSGGSDHHGDASDARRHVGAVTLPPAEYARLRERAIAAGCEGWPELRP